jgi:integrase
MVAKVVAWRDSRAATPRSADIGVMVLRELLKFGRLRGRVSINVATEIPTLYREGARADIVWTEDDIERFCWQAIADDRPQLIDAIWLAALTGLRREDLATVSRSNVYEYAIIKKALKVSRRRRNTATMPRIPELDRLLAELETRTRAAGVETLLVNSFGRPWTGDGLGGSFNRVRDAAEIFHVDPETGERKPKHLHDLRGTFCTRLITTTDLTDTEIAEVMGWSPQRIGNIRRTYVDQSRVVVAIGQRIAAGGVNRIVNRSGGGA